MPNGTRNEILDNEDRDVFDEILPEVMDYPMVIDDDGYTVMEDYREDFKNDMIVRFGDRVLSDTPKYWIQKRRAFFTQSFVSEIGKKLAIYNQDKELNVNYSQYQMETEYEHTEPVRNANENDVPTIKDKTKIKFSQPVGALGAASVVRDSINSVTHPFKDVFDKMEDWFIDEVTLAWIGDCFCR